MKQQYEQLALIKVVISNKCHTYQAVILTMHIETGKDKVALIEFLECFLGPLLKIPIKENHFIINIESVYDY